MILRSIVRHGDVGFRLFIVFFLETCTFVFAIRIFLPFEYVQAVIWVDEMEHGTYRGSRKSVARTVHEKSGFENFMKN